MFYTAYSGQCSLKRSKLTKKKRKRKKLEWKVEHHVTLCVYLRAYDISESSNQNTTLYFSAGNPLILLNGPELNKASTDFLAAVWPSVNSNQVPENKISCIHITH